MINMLVRVSGCLYLRYQDHLVLRYYSQLIPVLWQGRLSARIQAKYWQAPIPFFLCMTAEKPLRYCISYLGGRADLNTALQPSLTLIFTCLDCLRGWHFSLHFLLLLYRSAWVPCDSLHWQTCLINLSSFSSLHKLTARDAQRAKDDPFRRGCGTWHKLWPNAFRLLANVSGAVVAGKLYFLITLLTPAEASPNELLLTAYEHIDPPWQNWMYRHLSEDRGTQYWVNTSGAPHWLHCASGIGLDLNYTGLWWKWAVCWECVTIYRG